MNGHEQRKQNDKLGLAWINAFGNLRTAELGRLMWPSDPYARTRADRAARSWIERGFVLARTLPDGAGRTFVLSEAGARLLRNAGIEASSGKDIGETKAGAWSAPLNWKHDLITAGVLAAMHEDGYKIQPEREIRKRNPTLTKVPDGLAWKVDCPSDAFWLEVENARKSGKSMQELAHALGSVSDGNCPPVSDVKPTRALVAFVASARDERDYQLNHRLRVTAAIQRTAMNDVVLYWVDCALLGAGVSHIQITKEQIPAASVERMMKIIRAITWHEDEACVLSAHYGERRFYVWNDPVMGWTYQLNDEPAHQADTRQDAMRGCARLLSEGG